MTVLDDQQLTLFTEPDNAEHQNHEQIRGDAGCLLCDDELDELIRRWRPPPVSRGHSWVAR